VTPTHRPRDRENAYVADPNEVYAFVGRFFESLCAAGARHVVISPGSRSTPLSIAADRTSGLRTWIGLDERAAGFFALGLAKATRHPAVLICTSGTAAANYLPAIVEAHYSRVPLIVLTADRPPELRDWGVGQTIEQVGLYGHYPRWSIEVPVPAGGDDAIRYAGQLAARAVETARGTPAGVVHLNWPLREPLAPIADSVATATEATSTEEGIRFTRARLCADPADIRELVSLVRSRERGVILCGPMDPEPEFMNAIAEFASAAGWPVFADPTSQLRSAGTQPSAPILDMGDALARSPGFAEKFRPDFVLRIGDAPVSKAQRLWIEEVEPLSVWWLDEGGQWGEPSHRATRVVRGGGESLLGLAAAELAGHEGRTRPWCRRIEGLNETARKAMAGILDSENAWSGLSVAATVGRRMPADSLLFTSNSMSIRLLDLALANREARIRVFCQRGASGIDGVTSSALGVAAALNRPTLLLTGDLAFLHDLGGLLVARHEQIPLTLVVLDDNGGGIFSFLPVAAQEEAVGFERLFRTPHDLDLSRAAALFEIDYVAANSPNELGDALDAAFESPSVSIIHVRMDAALNEARFRECVKQVCESIDSGISE
jgi:2-succinyl-5-enolpyruvyl-6-hydroxy-3-cyclohexene-1-carboxylate synthase